MIIYPAIDLIWGAVVRLNKGDFDQQTTYGTDPISVAKSYAEAGASWLQYSDGWWSNSISEFEAETHGTDGGDKSRGIHGYLHVRTVSDMASSDPGRTSSL